MPHGISLHITPKNSNSYYLLWGSSNNLPASTTTGPSYKPALHIIIMPLQQALFYANSRPSPALTNALLTTSAPLPSPFTATLIQWSRQSSPTWQATRNLGTDYYARNQLLARNSTNNTQCTTPKVLAPHQWCSTAHRRSEGTNDSSGASSYRRCWCPSRNLCPFDRSFLINLLGITILLWLSSSKPGMSIYLINQMLFLTPTSNNTTWCARLISPSNQLSSSIDSSPSHLQLQQVYTESLFQPSWVYKQAVLDPYYSVSPLLLPRQHLLHRSLPHHCLLPLDVPFPDEKLVPEVPCVCLPRGHKFVFASPLALLPTCLPRGHRSQHHKSTLFQLSSQLSLSSSTSSHLCGAASCSCEPELLSGTTLPVGPGRPCGTVIAWWCKSLLSWARSCYLVPLL